MVLCIDPINSWQYLIPVIDDVCSFIPQHLTRSVTYTDTFHSSMEISTEVKMRRSLISGHFIEGIGLILIRICSYEIYRNFVLL